MISVYHQLVLVFVCFMYVISDQKCFVFVSVLLILPPLVVLCSSIEIPSEETVEPGGNPQRHLGSVWFTLAL